MTYGVDPEKESVGGAVFSYSTQTQKRDIKFWGILDKVHRQS